MDIVLPKDEKHIQNMQILWDIKDNILQMV